jgi:DNA mismatch repair protein MSH5
MNTVSSNITLVLVVYAFTCTGASIEIQRIVQKEFAFEKGRYTLMNWYMHYLQLWQEHEPKEDDGSEDIDSLANHHIYLRDPDEGNKTLAYLHLDGLIHLNESELTVSKYFLIE